MEVFGVLWCYDFIVINSEMQWTHPYPSHTNFCGTASLLHQHCLRLITWLPGLIPVCLFALQIEFWKLHVSSVLKILSAIINCLIHELLRGSTQIIYSLTIHADHCWLALSLFWDLTCLSSCLPIFHRKTTNLQHNPKGSTYITIIFYTWKIFKMDIRNLTSWWQTYYIIKVALLDGSYLIRNVTFS